MKVVFISNYLTHHQVPFCEEMVRLLKNEFVFIATEPIENERLCLGYKDLNNEYDFVFRAYGNQENKQKALNFCYQCDVLIYGSAPDEFFKKRVKAKKLTFKYGERFFKEHFTIKNVFKRTASMLKHVIPYQNKNHYLLCASAYMPDDCKLFGCFKNRMYRWGYFPEVKEHNLDELMAKKQKNKLLWVGRFLDWKHPEYAVMFAKKLKENGYDFNLDMIGCGEAEDYIKNMIERENLTHCVHMLGSMPPEKVREYMEKAPIFLFTSDRNEGWGAVLNESMNSGCAVVANKAIGSVPFILEHSKNGMVYDGSFDDFYNKAVSLLDNKEKAQNLGKKAYKTMLEEWNAKIAAERLIKLINLMQKDNNKKLYKNGPCSKAEYI